MVDKNDENDDWPIIFIYTRKQTIEDDVLIDVTDEAKSAGFRVPAAICDNLFRCPGGGAIWGQETTRGIGAGPVNP
jgi:hypothetical protein